MASPMSSTNYFYKTRQLGKLCLRVCLLFLYSLEHLQAQKALKIEAYQLYKDIRSNPHLVLQAFAICLSL